MVQTRWILSVLFILVEGCGTGVKSDLPLPERKKVKVTNRSAFEIESLLIHAAPLNYRGVKDSLEGKRLGVEKSFETELDEGLWYVTVLRKPNSNAASSKAYTTAKGWDTKEYNLLEYMGEVYKQKK